MIGLAAFAGLRCAEIARVHGQDLAGDVLRVHGKGGKVRDVPVLPRLLDRLQAVEGWAFPNGHGSHLTPGHVSRLLSRALPEGWTGHTLRHRLATAAYAGTRDLLAVSALLGHSRPELEQLAREVRSSSSGCDDEDDDHVVGSYEWVMGTD